MESMIQVRLALPGAVKSFAKAIWQIARLVFGYLVGILAMSGAADIVLIPKHLPPLQPLFFPFDRYACLVVAIVWAAIRIRRVIRDRARAHAIHDER